MHIIRPNISQYSQSKCPVTVETELYEAIENISTANTLKELEDILDVFKTNSLIDDAIVTATMKFYRELK